MLFDTTLLKTVRQTADTKGLAKGSQKLFEMLGIPSVASEGACPSKGPLLVIANHNGVFDTHVLLQTIHRLDYKFIALAIYQIFGETVRDRLLPIYRHIPWLHRLYEFPLQYETTGTFPKIMPHSVAHMENRKTIQHAAAWISGGGAVSMFPTGSVGRTRDGYRWKSGVGYLAAQIENPQTRVVFAHITGTRKSDVGAYLNPLFRKIVFRPQSVSVAYSKAYLLGDLVKRNDSGPAIAQRLEREYMSIFG